jgi:hypothetical protein
VTRREFVALLGVRRGRFHFGDICKNRPGPNSCTAVNVVEVLQLLSFNHPLARSRIAVGNTSLAS